MTLFRKLRTHMTFANTISMIALFIALGGVSWAAVTLPKNSVGATQIKKDAVSRSEVKKSAVAGDEVKNASLGPEEFKPGTAARAFARVAADGTLQPDVAGFPSQVKGIVQANIAQGEGGAATGTTCFDLPFRPASAMVVIDNADHATNIDQIATVSIDRGEDLGDCPATHNDARVRILDTDLTAGGAEQDPGPVDARFFVWFE
jgi:hypothetical protein